MTAYNSSAFEVAGDINSKVCQPCQDAGSECDRTTIRFRNGLTQSDGIDRTFLDQDNWPQVRGKIRFHDETPEIASLYVSTLDYGTVLPCQDISSEGHTRIFHSNNNLHNEQFHIGSTSTQQQLSKGFSQSSQSLFSSPPSRPPALPQALHNFTQREAILLRNFVENMALWADITDPYRHFESEVPARALKEPVLRCAIFAFSSRHLNRQNDSEAAEALRYHNECVQLLIPVLSEPEHITEEFLATVAILRQHEEMDGEDHQFHLTGTSHILNSVQRFGSSGGLGEAAAWLCLRQDIYVSLTTQRPLRTNLENFRGSDIFTRNDDFAWSSRMVFLLAKVLQSAFSDVSPDNSIDVEVENWVTSKPYTFEPVRMVARGTEIDQRFPSIWMLLPVHVIGLQYYHIAKIVLALSASSPMSTTYETFRQTRQTERNIRYHLLRILGLAQSNARAENTLFTARHSLVAWGWVLRHRSDQKAAECLLHDMHERTGWNMDTLIESLRQQWQDDDGSSGN
ncbi:uncharacterized protein N7458_008669 [Penicillium daleae]|uniref:Zn(II)2Cys6 transcription factor n=1 Tax=Penicillium daleae TaxID=63821 RepID=A0AAD6C322_9EURO|nr:uncharacterized protein N7458_008669 [Penicillium daleae]KAJ5444797.1 hypothetical protein N7458_008669 [Penicillium daleae]